MFQDHTRYPCGIFQGVSVSLWAFILLVYLQSSYSQNTHQEFKVLGQRALHHFPFLHLPRPRATAWTPRWPALFACSCEWNHSVKMQQNICTRYTLKSVLCQMNSKQLNVITKRKMYCNFDLVPSSSNISHPQIHYKKICAQHEITETTQHSKP